MQRREFLQQTGLVLAGLCVTDSIFSKAWANSEISIMNGSELTRVPILQGATSDSVTQFTLLMNSGHPIDVQLLDPAGQPVPYRYEIHGDLKGRSSYQTIKIYVSGLSPNLKYRLLAYDVQTGKLRDERTFSTLDIHSTSHFNFAIVSCMSDQHFGVGDGTWPALLAEKPQAVFIIGDAAYVNHGDENVGSFWNLHVQSRVRICYYYTPTLIPTFLMWDDHDTGKNNCDGSYSLKEDALKMWNSFFGSEDIPGVFETGSGTNGYFTGFGQNFFLLDDRSFRQRHQSNVSIWGPEGEDFLFSRLEKTNRPSYLMNGVQYFGGYLLGSESFEKSHRASFKQTLKRLSQVESPVVFASGDVHFSEIMKIEKKILGYNTLEITSSSMHSSSFPWQQFRSFNHRRLMSTSLHNFVMVDSTVADSGKLGVKLRSIGAKGKTYFKHQTEISR